MPMDVEDARVERLVSAILPGNDAVAFNQCNCR